MRGDSFLQLCDEATDMSSMLLLLGILWAHFLCCVYMGYVVTGAWQRCSASQTQLHLQHQKSPRRCSVFCLGHRGRPQGCCPAKPQMGWRQFRAGQAQDSPCCSARDHSCSRHATTTLLLYNLPFCIFLHSVVVLSLSHSHVQTFIHYSLCAGPGHQCLTISDFSEVQVTSLEPKKPLKKP